MLKMMPFPRIRLAAARWTPVRREPLRGGAASFARQILARWAGGLRLVSPAARTFLAGGGESQPPVIHLRTGPSLAFTTRLAVFHTTQIAGKAGGAGPERIVYHREPPGSPAALFPPLALKPAAVRPPVPWSSAPAPTIAPVEQPAEPEWAPQEVVRGVREVVRVALEQTRVLVTAVGPAHTAGVIATHRVSMVSESPTYSKPRGRSGPLPEPAQAASNAAEPVKRVLPPPQARAARPNEAPAPPAGSSLDGSPARRSPPPGWPPENAAFGEGPAAGFDHAGTAEIERLADQVVRVIDNRVTAHRERMGRI